MDEKFNDFMATVQSDEFATEYEEWKAALDEALHAHMEEDFSF